MYFEKRLTSKTFGAEIHGFTGAEETGEKRNVNNLLRRQSFTYNKFSTISTTLIHKL